MRRWLGFSIDEWDALPWWQQEVYLEGLQAEIEARSAPAAGDGEGGGGMEFIDPFAGAV